MPRKLTKRVTPELVIRVVAEQAREGHGGFKARHLTGDVLRGMGVDPYGDTVTRADRKSVERKIGRVIRSHPNMEPVGWGNGRRGYDYVSPEELEAREQRKAERDATRERAQTAAEALGLSPKRVHYDGTLRLEPEELIALAERMD